MIKRISTENGESWAIVLNPLLTLENVRGFTSGLIEVMQNSIYNDEELPKDTFYNTLTLLSEMILTSEQAGRYESFLRQSKQINKE